MYMPKSAQVVGQTPNTSGYMPKSAQLVQPEKKISWWFCWKYL